jgi:hypothetical protein
MFLASLLFVCSLGMGQGFLIFSKPHLRPGCKTSRAYDNSIWPRLRNDKLFQPSKRAFSTHQVVKFVLKRGLFDSEDSKSSRTKLQHLTNLLIAMFAGAAIGVFTQV